MSKTRPKKIMRGTAENASMLFEKSATFGAKLKACRKWRHLTQTELARLIGGKTNKDTISRLERGDQRPKADEVPTFEKALKLPPGTFGYGPKVKAGYVTVKKETLEEMRRSAQGIVTAVDDALLGTADV
jgi:transcriptional regulator with XRE-family HTH domain